MVRNFYVKTIKKIGSVKGEVKNPLKYFMKKVDYVGKNAQFEEGGE